MLFGFGTGGGPRVRVFTAADQNEQSALNLMKKSVSDQSAPYISDTQGISLSFRGPEFDQKDLFQQDNITKLFL